MSQHLFSFCVIAHSAIAFTTPCFASRSRSTGQTVVSIASMESISPHEIRGLIARSASHARGM
jgi:hypothetical protein